TSVLAPQSSVLETEHRPLTKEGTILGTVQYMAPEQLEGEEAGARTDIFALGTILYEMATGRRAFQGKTRTSLIAAIVDRDPPPSGATFEFFIDGGAPVISPDGKKIVFSAALGTATRTLWVRTIDSPIPRPLPGTEGAGHPFWSPDSRYIAFYAASSLKKVHFGGGAPVVICPIEPPRGGDWGRDGTILIGYTGSGVLKVPAAGGTP